ncbi:OmpA family protein [Flavobacteriaceae bacterium TP-CH-4]|uniref:OmpA family protein n=1 Tax=Pelagihabitans pacificus TaxID=2696054 RepID=A0A967AQ72_9FLAO|nr:OmpA family protein [Pelagihabitans pacificus]NHF58328.1 OmpA family protein [Pelagihabitans pacificus]
MRIRIFILFFLTTAFLVTAQDIKTKGDKYFYAYAYEDAIKEYGKEMQKGFLMTNHQLLNLADSYFKTNDYTNAAKWYLDVYKNDTIMSNNRFNSMLQSLAKTSEPERVKAFLKSNEGSLSTELVENAAFNYELLQSETADNGGFFVFNIDANSPQDDFAPTFYKDKLLFSSSRKSKSKKIYGPSGESYMDIYVARINGGGKVMNPNIFEKIPESSYHKATPYHASGIDRIFYVLSNEEDGELTFDDRGKNSLAIGVTYDNGFFRNMLKDLSTSFYYPFFDEVSERLYFAADFPDGYGGTDIYYVSTVNSQVMSAPVNLGPRINTPGNEIAPYFMGNSLFFSSDVFYGLGGMDIYKAYLQADDSFSTPVNLGEGINSPDDDFGFIIRPQDMDGYIGYFSSNRKGGKGGDDIYGFKISREPGLKTLLVRGEVRTPKTEQGIGDVSVKLLDGEQNLIKEVFTQDDGSYQLEVPWREDVSLKVSKPGYSTFNKTYTESGLEELKNNKQDVEIVSLEELVEKRENQDVLKLDSFVFERGKTEIVPEIAVQLDKVVEAVEQFPKMRLQIETHTDSRGSSSSNKRLSQKRADAIRLYLEQKDVTSANIVSATGYGEEKILNSCTNGVYCLDFLHDQNARTNFVVLNYEELNQ